MATDPAMKITPPYVPELLPGVQKLVEEFLSKRRMPIVLEVGSGWSTVWLAGIAAVVHSLEHAPDWRRSVERACLDADRHENVRIDLVRPDSIAAHVGSGQNMLSGYDVILIDCVDEARLPTLFASLHRLAPDGMVILDDSHWDMFKNVPPVMKDLGFEMTRVCGDHTRKTGEVKYHQTDIYQRKR